MKGCRLVMWGILLISFHIYLGQVQVVPSWIGILIIAFGMKTIEKQISGKLMKRAKESCLCWALVLLAAEGAGAFNLAVSFREVWGFILNGIFIILELLVFHYFFWGLEEGTSELDGYALYPRGMWAGWDRIYLVFMTMAGVLTCTGMCFNLGWMGIVGSVGITVLRVLTALKLGAR